MSSRIISGKWQSFREDLLINYQGRRRAASVEYSNKIDRKGRISANVWHDRNNNNRRDPGEKVVASYKARIEVVANQIDFNSVERGAISLNKKKGEFELFYEGSKFATGVILDRDFFF
jgi:hypothetical protein